MKNKLFIDEKIRDVRMIFGSGVSTFLDRARKFLYLIPDAHLRSIQIRHHRLSLISFPTSDSSWNEFKTAELQKDSMMLSHIEMGIMKCYKIKILGAISIRNRARIVALLEDVNQEHLQEYWNMYIKRYHNIDDSILVQNAYLYIDRFLK